MLGTVLRKRVLFHAGRRTCATTAASTHPPKSQFCIPRQQLNDPNKILPWPGTDRFRELAAAAQCLESARSTTGSKTTSYHGNNTGSFSTGHTGGDQVDAGYQADTFTQQTNTARAGGLNGLNGHHNAPAAEKAPLYVQYVTDYGVPYYHNTETNETMWELPKGESAICSQTGNPVAQQAEAAPVQEEKKPERVVEQKQTQQKVEVKQEEKVVQQKEEKVVEAKTTDPASDLTVGWETYYTEEGRPYYYHRPSGLTQWEKPKM